MNQYNTYQTNGHNSPKKPFFNKLCMKVSEKTIQKINKEVYYISRDSLVNQQLHSTAKIYQLITAALTIEELGKIEELKTGLNSIPYLYIDNLKLASSKSIQDYSNKCRMFAIGLSELLGKSICYEDEKNLGLAHLIESKRVKSLFNPNIFVQNENARFENREDFNLLYVGSQCHHNPVNANIIDIDTILLNLDPLIIFELMQPQFYIKCSKDLKNKKITEYSAPTAVIIGGLNAPEIRVSLNNDETTSVSSKGREALAKLKYVVQTKSKELKLQQGQALITNNRRTLCGFTNQNPKNKTTQSTIYQTRIMSSLWECRQYQSENERILKR